MFGCGGSETHFAFWFGAQPEQATSTLIYLLNFYGCVREVLNRLDGSNVLYISPLHLN